MALGIIQVEYFLAHNNDNIPNSAPEALPARSHSSGEQQQWQKFYNGCDRLEATASSSTRHALHVSALPVSASPALCLGSQRRFHPSFHNIIVPSRQKGTHQSDDLFVDMEPRGVLSFKLDRRSAGGW